MNTVWKDLDPIFKHTLRKYVTGNNRSLFEIYAKAVGFNPNHLGLLYLTLQLEQDQFETKQKQKQKHTQQQQSSHPNSRKRSHSEIYDSSDEFDEFDDNKQNDDNDNYHHNVSNINIKTITPKKKRRKLSLKNNKQQSIIKKEGDEHKEQLCFNNQPSITSVVCRMYPMKNSQSIVARPEIPNLYQRRNNQNMNDYEKLKLLSSQSFRNTKLPSAVLQKNQKKINNLLSNLDAYKTTVFRRHTQTTTKTTTMTTISHNARHSQLIHQNH